MLKKCWLSIIVNHSYPVKPGAVPNPKATKGPLKEVFGVHGVSISGLEVKKRMLS